MPTESLPLAFLLLIAIVISVFVFVRRITFLISILLKGRRENRFDNLPLRIKAFFAEVMGQSRMIHGDSIIRWAHPAIFWGFCAFLVASNLMLIGGVLAPFIRIPQVESIPILGTIVDLFAVAVLVGLGASSYRRYILRPQGLQITRDASIVVILIAALMVTFLLAEAGSRAEEQLAPKAGEHELGFLSTQTWLPAGIVTTGILRIFFEDSTIIWLGTLSWWLHVAVLLGFLMYLPYSKHMHLLWSPFAVFFTEIPQKGILQDAPETPEASAPINSNFTLTQLIKKNEPKPEAEPAEAPKTPLTNFTWRQLLSAYACAECGRCERACPAFASGAQLNPRELMHVMKLWVLEEGKRAADPNYKGDGKKVVGDVVTPEILWACTSCYACMEKCPVRNEHVPILVQMRRELVNEGTLDPNLQNTLQFLQRYGNSFGQSARKRAAWAKNRKPEIPDVLKEPVDYLWFVGDYASFNPVLQEITKLTADVFQSMGLSFGILYDKEQSAGNDVRRVGEEGLYQMLQMKNKEILEKANYKYIITSDPHTYHTLKNEYKLRGPNGENIVFHYIEILDRFLREGKLQFKKKLSGKITFHDPCYLGRYNGIFEEPRRIIEALGLELVEMPRNRDDSFCCGAGGGRLWMEDTPGIKERPSENRIKEALALNGVSTFVVICPKDVSMFQDAIKTVGCEDKMQVKELMQLLAEALVAEGELKAEAA